MIMKNIPKLDLSSDGYSKWKCECYILFLENGEKDEFE